MTDSKIFKKICIFVSRSKTRALRRNSIWFSGSRYSYLGTRPLDKRNASAGDEIERDWKTNNWRGWPLYTGSTVLKYLVGQDWLFIAGLYRLWWYSKRMLFSIQQFAIYLKVYWNGRTVFLFIICGCIFLFWLSLGCSSKYFQKSV